MYTNIKNIELSQSNTTNTEEKCRFTIYNLTPYNNPSPQEWLESPQGKKTILEANILHVFKQYLTCIESYVQYPMEQAATFYPLDQTQPGLVN